MLDHHPILSSVCLIWCASSPHIVCCPQIGRPTDYTHFGSV